MKYLIWLAAFAMRFVLMVAGVFLVLFSLAGDGQRQTPKMWRWFGRAEDVPVSYGTSRWRKYVWMAWRNPLEGLDSTLKQPVPEKHPNPDYLVRSLKGKSASRFMKHGIFWEYWYLRRSIVLRGAQRYFEFRIGWKFVDGNKDFVPTLQFGLKK
jgi:hypothetical protein